MVYKIKNKLKDNILFIRKGGDFYECFIIIMTLNKYLINVTY